MSLDDLKEGMILKGKVRNITDFGAFVDIGVGTDGLVHISEISDKFIKNPHDVLTNSEVVTCLLYTSPSPRDISGSRMPSSA